MMREAVQQLPTYEERGSGPAVVFSHGTLMDRSMFYPQIDALSVRYRTVAYDHRARTSRWSEPYSIRDLAEDCLQVLGHLEIEKCTLAGMSMGGFMALEFALAYPERLDAIIIINSHAQGYGAEDRATYGPKFAELDIDGTVPREWAEWAAALLFGKTTQAHNPELVEHWTDRWSRLRARSVVHETNSWLFKDDLSDRVTSIVHPTLVLYGVEDTPLRREMVEPMVDAMPNARLVEVPGAGHTSNVENPAVTNEAILAFLAEVYGQ